MIPGGNIDSRRESSAFSRGLSEAIPTEKCAPVIVSRRESSGAIQDDSWRKHPPSSALRRYRYAQPTAKSGMYPCGIPAML